MKALAFNLVAAALQGLLMAAYPEQPVHPIAFGFHLGLVVTVVMILWSDRPA